MNIIFLIADKSSSSPTVGIRYLVSLLKQRDIAVHEIVIPNSKASNTLFRLLDEVRFARRAIRNLGSSQSIIMSYGFKLDLINALCGEKKRVSSIRGELRSNYRYSFGIVKGSLYFWIHWIALTKFKNIVLMSKFFEVPWFIPKSKITIIPNLFDFSSLRNLPRESELHRESSTFRLITCGAASKLKGASRLPTVLVRSGSCRLTVDWYGSQNSYDIGNVVFHRPIATSKIPYSDYNAYLSLSYSEGHSRAVLEAIASGLPVICREIPGNISLRDEYEVKGLLFYQTDDDLKRILHALSSKTFIPESSDLGIFFASELLVDRWIKVFRRLNLHA